MLNIVRFDNQNILWTLKELDVIIFQFNNLKRHSDAFAFGLVQLGYKIGDKIGLYLSDDLGSEILASTIGSIKAGVSI